MVILTNVSLSIYFFHKNFESGPTCKYGFVRLKLPPAHGQRDVTEFLVFEKQSQIVRQPALWHLKLYSITLTGNVHAVRHHADLQKRITQPV